MTSGVNICNKFSNNHKIWLKNKFKYKNHQKWPKNLGGNGGKALLNFPVTWEVAKGFLILRYYNLNFNYKIFCVITTQWFWHVCLALCVGFLSEMGAPTANSEWFAIVGSNFQKNTNRMRDVVHFWNRTNKTHPP